MRALPLLLLAAVAAAAAPAGASPLVPVANAAYVDGAGNAHLATFSYAGPCDGLGATTVRLLDTGETLVAQVLSRTVGNVCGASLACDECPPVPEAYAWELTGLGVVLAGGGPAYYDAYADRPLGYSLSGEYLGGVLTAFGVASLGPAVDPEPVCDGVGVDTWAAGASWPGCGRVEGHACTQPAWYGGHGLLGGWVCEGRTSFPLP